jgi:hypothetical protein
MNMDNKYTACRHCTYKLVSIAYKRVPWFRLFREPLKLGMRILVAYHGIDLRDLRVHTPGCTSCIRFYKTALSEKSSTFRRLHNIFNPLFNKLIGKITTEEERRQAKTYADLASEGKINREDAAEWMKDLKPTL